MADSELEKEANSRLKDARDRKAVRVIDFRECYFFGAPNRHRQISSETQPSTTPLKDAPELHTDLGYLLLADFVTEVTNTYLPEAQQWCERKAGEGVSEDDFEEVSEDVRSADKKIFEAIKASNLYAEIPKAFNPDLAIGGAGLFIDRPRVGQPIWVLAVPMREVEINLGPDGEVDDRFIVKWVRNCYVQKELGPDAWAEVDAETRTKLKSNPSDRSEVRKGWWRKWEDVGDETWQHVIMLGAKLLYSGEIKGEGSCAFLFMRFAPDADWPWANGPLIQGLPTMRQVDEWERQIPEAVERAVNPAITFPDDSFAQVEQGIEPGMAYPVRPGTANDVKNMYEQHAIDPELVDLERKEHRLKKLFYVDHPEQTGDTPPTLGQWLDELARMQRRIGTAGYSFWREGPMKIFLRFKYLLEKAGTIAEVKNKSGKAISTQPYNPTQRAAEQQEIATAVQFLQIAFQTFPEEARAAIDGTLTMDALIKKMRVSGLVKQRDEASLKKALPIIAQLIGGRQRAGGAEPPEGAGAPAAV